MPSPLTSLIADFAWVNDDDFLTETTRPPAGAPQTSLADLLRKHPAPSGATAAAREGDTSLPSRARAEIPA